MEPIPQQSLERLSAGNNIPSCFDPFQPINVAHRTEKNTSLLIGLEKISTKSMRLKHCAKIFVNTRLRCLTNNWIRLLNTKTFGSVI